ncbi:MAG: hypothetical protein ACERKZ_13520 [Lachnotalea sp.]
MLKRCSLIVKELLMGIVVFGIITELILLLVTQDKIFNSIGFVLGLITAAGMCIHMHVSLEDAIDMDSGDAQKHINKAYGIRTAAVLLVLGLLFYTNIGSIITGFIGIMSLKVAAYLQPITHKCFQKYIGKGR